MEKERDIYFGIALYYCIAIITDLLVALFTDIIGFIAPPEYMMLTPICLTVIYILVLYVVFWRFKSYPDIKWWFFILLLVFQYIPRLTYILNPVDEHFISRVSDYNEIISVVFTFFFAYFAYKLNKQARNLRGVDDELNPQYIYYGMVLIPLIAPLLDIVRSGVLALCRYATLSFPFVCVLAALFFVLFISLFFVILKKKIMIRGVYLFIIPLAAILTNKFGAWHAEYEYTLEDYGNIYVLSTWFKYLTILIICQISFIRYYQIDHFDNSTKKARVKQWIYCIVLTLVLSVGSLVINFFSL